MLSKKHKLPRIFISFIVCFISIQKSRCQTTLAATNPQTTVTPVDCSPPGYCKNGGVCIEGVVCQCQPGFSGDVCENIGCINDPTYCKNGGECIDAACQCPMGFTGDMCEIIECSSGTCQNGGDCLTELTSDPSNVCICAPGFQGTFCEEVDPEGTCILNCEGGNCTSNHTCVCDPGFKGTYCQEQITCFDEPCQNGGTCVLLARRKRQVFLPPSSAGCSCRVPYTGSFCEIELPPCDIDCKNNGECLLHPETLNYYCACAINYYGDFCENAELCDEIGCNGMGTCVEGSCVCLEGHYGAFCELDICSTRPCENGGLCILPINEFFSEVFTPVTEFQCACAPGFRGPTCTGVIVECSRNEYLCASGECIPLSKKCDSITYDCADNSDEPDRECNNNNECRDLLANLDLMTRECGELSTPFRSFIESESVSLINVWKFNSPPSDFPGASNIISQITINIEPYMGTDILSDGTLFVALISEKDGIQTQVYNFEVLYQNDNGQTKFIKYLTDIYNMGFNGQYVSLSFLPDGSTDHTLLPYFKCEIINEEIIEEETSSCITLMTRMFVPECNFNNCIDRYGDWKQASYQKRDLNCGVSSIDSVVDSTYQPCLSPPFIASVSRSMDVGIEEVVYLYCVAYGEPTPAVKWLEVSETGEVINTSEPADGQIVFELPDVTSATRYVCLAANVANEVVSDDVVISLEDPVCSSLQNLSREFSVTNSVCFNETVKNILSNEGQFGGFTYIDEFTEGTVLYAVSFSSTNVDVGGGEMSFSSTSVEQIGPVVLSMYLVISDVITGVVIYSHVFEGIIIVDPNIESRNPINLSFDTPIKINSTSRYEFRLSTTDQSYQLNNQPLDVKYVTCASGTQGCQEFISDWNGLISDQIDAGCDDIDIQYTAAELCFGEFFGDPEVIRHPESQDNAIGITTLECNIENVEFYEWYKNSKRITSSGPTYSLQLQDGQDQGDYACLGFRSQDDKDASSNTATVLITGVSTFRVIARFQIAFERAYTDRESEKFKNFTRDLQTSLESKISTPFELYITSIKSGSVITEMEMYFSDQAQNASAVSVMINDTLVALPEYETDPSSVIVTSISTCVGEDVTQDGILYSFSDTPLDATAESVQDCPLYSDQGL
ncbi:uncharacterized protein LOC117123763 [Anneissia japonica]|uniref:uncharacterized protein LOC117123763 n=1 Tax=Anneissia japonica TaxID=1529436 RepID=UPI0014256466|nr:uncharacterized protein LOC117123763 [Anneissia japonica]